MRELRKQMSTGLAAYLHCSPAFATARASERCVGARHERATVWMINRYIPSLSMFLIRPHREKLRQHADRVDQRPSHLQPCLLRKRILELTARHRGSAYVQ